MKKVYIVSSDEILLRDEKVSRLCKEAKKLNFPRPTRFILGEGAEHSAILSQISNPSLFSPLSMFLVIAHQLPLNSAAEKTLEKAATSIDDDTLLIISLPRLNPAMRKKKWFKSLEKKGEYIPLYPPAGANLRTWIAQRAAQHKLKLSSESIEFLAQNNEGNLNGAVQELKKIALSYPEQEVEYKEVCQAVGDSAYYEIFALSDSILAGDISRCRSILQQLKYLKESITTINWLVTKDIKMLLAISQKPAITDQDLYKFGCFGPRRTLARQAALRFTGVRVSKLNTLLRVAAKIDRATKGGSDDNPWQLIEGLALSLAGLVTPAFTAYLKNSV